MPNVTAMRVELVVQNPCVREAYTRAVDMRFALQSKINETNDTGDTAHLTELEMLGLMHLLHEQEAILYELMERGGT